MTNLHFHRPDGFSRRSQDDVLDMMAMLDITPLPPCRFRKTLRRVVLVHTDPHGESTGQVA